jgi:hypothetical protein
VFTPPHHDNSKHCPLLSVAEVRTRRCTRCGAAGVPGKGFLCIDHTEIPRGRRISNLAGKTPWSVILLRWEKQSSVAPPYASSASPNLSICSADALYLMMLRQKKVAEGTCANMVVTTGRPHQTAGQTALLYSRFRRSYTSNMHGRRRGKNILE